MTKLFSLFTTLLLLSSSLANTVKFPFDWGKSIANIHNFNISTWKSSETLSTPFEILQHQIAMTNESLKMYLIEKGETSWIWLDFICDGLIGKLDRWELRVNYPATVSVL